MSRCLVPCLPQAELAEHFGIAFNNLFTMTNMPVKRFADFLYRRKQLPDYMKLLVDNFNEAALPNTMCQNLVSVRWYVGYLRAAAASGTSRHRYATCRLQGWSAA